MIKNRPTETTERDQTITLNEIQLTIIKHLFFHFNSIATYSSKSSLKNELTKRIHNTLKDALNLELKQIASFLYAAATTAKAAYLRIELKTVKNDSELWQNILEYIPIDQLTLNDNSGELNSNTSANHVHHFVLPGEKVNKSIKIRLSNLVYYLAQNKKLTLESLQIPAIIGDRDSIVSIFGTTRNGIPQSIIFFADGTKGISTSTHNTARLRRKGSTQPRFGTSLKPV